MIGQTALVFNKALRSYIFAMAGQTAGPNWLKCLGKFMGNPGGDVG